MDCNHREHTAQPGSVHAYSPQPDSGWAAGAHLVALVTSLIGAVILNVIVARQPDFVRQHARQAVNFQLNAIAASFALAVFTMLAPVLVLTWAPLAIALFAMPIVAAVRASRGDWHPYPPMIPFLRELPEPLAEQGSRQ